MYRAALLLAVLCFARPSAAQAGGQTEPKKVPPEVAELLKLTPDAFVKRFDKNKDGVLTRDELPQFLARPFERFDANGDGKLDRQEVGQMLQGLRGLFGAQPKDAKEANAAVVEKIVDNLLRQFDDDKDGKISKKEAKAKLLLLFDRFDANKDNFLDRKELRQVAMFILGQRGGQGPAGKGPGLDFDALDRNADGRLTREEVRGSPLAKLFDQIDTNRDGRLSREEFEAYLEKTRAKTP